MSRTSRTGWLACCAGAGAALSCQPWANHSRRRGCRGQRLRGVAGRQLSSASGTRQRAAAATGGAPSANVRARGRGGWRDGGRGGAGGAAGQAARVARARAASAHHHIDDRRAERRHPDRHRPAAGTVPRSDEARLRSAGVKLRSAEVRLISE